MIAKNFLKTGLIFLLGFCSILSADNEEVLESAWVQFESHVQDINLEWVRDSNSLLGRSLQFTNLTAKVNKWSPVEGQLSAELSEYLEANKDEMQIEFDEYVDDDSETGEILGKYRQWFGMGTVGEVSASGRMLVQKVKKMVASGKYGVEEKVVFRSVIDFYAYPSENRAKIVGDYTVVNSTTVKIPVKATLISAKRKVFLKKVHWPIPLPEFSRAYYKFTVAVDPSSIKPEGEIEPESDEGLAYAFLQERVNRFRADATSKVWKYSDVYKQVERYLRAGEADKAVVDAQVRITIFTEKSGRKRFSHSLNIMEITGPNDVVDHKKYSSYLKVKVNRLKRVISLNRSVVNFEGVVNGTFSYDQGNAEWNQYLGDIINNKTFSLRTDVGENDGADAMKKHKAGNGIRGNLEVVVLMESVRETYRSGKTVITDSYEVEGVRGDLASWYDKYSFDKEWKPVNTQTEQFQNLYKQ